MISIPLRLALRAERSYIHGTDLYSATHAAFAEHFARTSFTHIRIRIGRFYRHPLALVMEEGDAARDWQCEVDGRLWSARWEELSPAIVLPRRPFDEIALARHVRFAEKAAVLTGNPGWEPIECAVFLVKMLHERLRPSGRGRRWIFSRLDLERSLLPSDLHGMSASLEAELGDSFTRTRLRGGGSDMGQFFFSAVEDSVVNGGGG
jgi:hypothetical protein